MDRENTESSDVSEDKGGAEVFVVATIPVFSGGIAGASLSPGVVLCQRWPPQSSHYEITVELDKSRWRQITPGDNEVWKVADDSPESDSLARTG